MGVSPKLKRKIIVLSDDDKDVLRGTHEWLDAYVPRWCKLLHERTSISTATISRTMNAWNSTRSPNTAVLLAAKALYFEKKAEKDAAFNYVKPVVNYAVEGLENWQ